MPMDPAVCVCVCQPSNARVGIRPSIQPQVLLNKHVAVGESVISRQAVLSNPREHFNTNSSSTDGGKFSLGIEFKKEKKSKGQSS